MKPVTFKLKCEADVDRFLGYAVERLEKATGREKVSLVVPNGRWPELVISMMMDATDGVPDAADGTINMDIEFDILNGDGWDGGSYAEDSEKLREQIEDMSDDELDDFISDILSDLEDEADEDDDDNGDNDNA